jgi:O-antigen ligase
LNFIKAYIPNLIEDKYNFSFSFLFVFLIVAGLIVTLQLSSAIAVIILLSVVLLFFLSFNFYLLFEFIILTIFTPYIFTIHQVVFFSLFLILSFLLNFKINRGKKYYNPILLPLFIYIFLASISLYNAPMNIYTFMEYANLVSIFLLVFLVPIVYYKRESINKFFYLFISAIFLHSIFIILQGLLTRERSFGFLGVYFVDLAGLGVLYSIIYFFYNHNYKKVIFGSLFTVILVALVFSQTRNAWLSTLFTLVFLLTFLLIKGNKFNIKRLTILKFIGIFSLISIIIFFVIIQDLNINVGKRLDEKTQKVNVTDNPNSLGENSILSRMLIWHTAINAFSEKPFFGIGTYTFKYTSKNYYTIPKPFFKQYVEHRTPHVTYLEVLVESGIIGFIGFLFFLFSVIKLTIKSVRYKLDKKLIPQTLLIMVSIVYITFSMFMTEAWLYGQYIVWFGIIIGLLIVNSRIIYQEALSK